MSLDKKGLRIRGSSCDIILNPELNVNDGREEALSNLYTVLCKSNDSEFRRISTKFYEILRKSAKFRGERIFGEISLASIVSPLTKFRADVRNFTWQIR